MDDFEPNDVMPADSGAAPSDAPARAATRPDSLSRTVRAALIVFAVAAATFAGTSALVGKRLNGPLAQASDAAITSRDVAVGLLDMRRLEMDFLASLSPQIQDEHRQAMDRTREAIEAMRSNPSVSVGNNDLLDRISEAVENYASAADRVFMNSLAAGRNAESGADAEYRSAGMALTALVEPLKSPALDMAMMQARTQGRDFVIFHGPKYVEQFDERVRALGQLVDATKVTDEARKALHEAIDAYQQKMHAFAGLVMKRDESLNTAREYAAQAQEPLKLVQQAAQAGAGEQRQSIGVLLVSSAAALLAVFAVIGALLWRAQRQAAANLNEQESARRAAEAENDRLNDSVVSVLQAVNLLSQRDLTVRAPVTQDVVGTVSDSINLLTDETSKVLHGVTDIATQVQQVSAKVKSQADRVSLTAESERRSVSAMVDSLADATQAMNEVATLAEQSNASAEQATVVTDGALGTVNETVRGMQSIRETIAETEKRIKRLGERSQEISGIVNLINTISERTHVLALNASMQAAVAGEAGRGFAVVAEEVQRLAESSRNATQQIATLVGNIQLETNETISTVNRTIGQVVQGSEQARRAGEQMRRTQQITMQLVAQVRSIAQASEQQKAGSATLLQAVQQIGRSTEDTAQQIDAQNRETETLLAASRQLVDSVRVFKLPEMA